MCVQLAKHLGAEVFGTVGSAEKVEFLKSLGCDHVILYRDQNFADAVLDLTDGEGVDLCLDSVGAETFEDSVRCTHILGTVGLFGVASGQPEPGISCCKILKPPENSSGPLSMRTQKRRSNFGPWRAKPSRTLARVC